MGDDFGFAGRRPLLSYYFSQLLFVSRPLDLMRLPSFIAFCTLGLLPVALPAKDPMAVAASPKAIDEALAGKQTYNYFVISANELGDTDGRHIPLKGIRAYLKRNKPEKNAAYIFWIPDEGAIETAKAAINTFSKYGASVFVVRKMDGPLIPGDVTNQNENQSKTAMLVGRPNAKSHTSRDKFPAMAERPISLRPAKLPTRVRYQFKSDAQVVTAAELTVKLLIDPERADPSPAFGDICLLQPGAWNYLYNLSELVGTKSIVSKVELNGVARQFEGRLAREPEQFRASIERVRSLLSDDGGATVRALKTGEMDHWWTYIGFDIEEPVFAVESTGGKYVFVVTWNHDHVFGIDELNALP